MTSMGTMGLKRRGGFTLIELLVVISIIAVLAGLIAGLAPKMFDARSRSRVTVERDAIINAIDGYQTTMGFYPPDNSKTDGEERPQLYYELTGTVTAGGNFIPLEGSALSVADVDGAFGVKGFLNTGNDRQQIRNFFPTIPRTMAQTEGNSNIRYLVVPVRGPKGSFNTWRYDSHSEDRHNSQSYDLWAEIILGGKTNSINNWSK